MLPDDWMTPIKELKAPRRDRTVKCPCCGNKWVMPETPVAIKCARCGAVLLMEIDDIAVREHGRTCKGHKR